MNTIKSRLKTRGCASINIGMTNMSRRNKVRDAFLGLAIGDALGVPFELVKREELERDPVTDMMGNKAHNKPPGTWSDDASMTFCTAESLLDGFDIERMGKLYLSWFDEGYWSADGKAFGSGGTTRAALKKVREGHLSEGAGRTDPESNGNGSLMRILPLAFYMDRLRISHFESWNFIKRASAITHGHSFAQLACFYYVDFAMKLLMGKSKECAYMENEALLTAIIIYEKYGIDSKEMKAFDRLIKSDISKLPSSEIRSGSYVVDSLEAAIWCLMTSNSYKETVLKAVNLGGDSDSTAAIAGGLAGILYGLDDVPETWMKKLARKDDIERLANEFTYAFLNWYA